MSISACGDPEARAPEFSRARAPIINGTPDPAESGTVWVTHFDYPFLCSGTLIASTLVTTAKHCAVLERDSAADQPLAGDRFRVGFGAQSGALTWRGSSRMEWVGMPGNTEVAPAVDSGEDIALIWLSSAAPSTAKIHTVKLDYVPSVGQSITIVGYGRSSLGSNASGVKLSTVDAVSGFSPSTGIVQTTGKGACSGDSGGSFFFGAARELVGVTSTAGGSSPTSFCDVGITNATSVRNPRVNQLLANALGIVGVCAPQPELCGDGLDQDCDGIADNQCRQDGQSCTKDVDCATGVCRDLGAGKVCARACDDRVRCPTGQRCVTSCTEGWCEPGAQGNKALLESCASSSECATNHCSTAGCSNVCNPTLGQCPDDMACRMGAGCGECLPLASVPDPRDLGETCVETRDCATDGTCVDDGFGIKRCAMPCLEGNTCPPGLACRNDRCVRTGGFSLGERCLAPEDCSSFLCALFPDKSQNYCTRECTQSSDCGSGFDCLDAFGSRVCVPAGALLGKPCQADSQCTSNRCQTTLGRCTRPCAPKLLPCPAGFLCEVESGALICVPGPNAYPEPPVPELEAGIADSGGSDAGVSGNGGSAGAPQQPGGADSGGVRDGGASDGGCSCQTQKPGRWPIGSVSGMLAVLVAAWRKSGHGVRLRARLRRASKKAGAWRSPS